MALIREWIGDVGELLQDALTQQKYDDLFEILCQTCGGLGVEINLDDLRHIDGRGNPNYGGQTCGECEGWGYVR